MVVVVRMGWRLCCGKRLVSVFNIIFVVFVVVVLVAAVGIVVGSGGRLGW